MTDKLQSPGASSDQGTDVEAGAHGAKVSPTTHAKAAHAANQRMLHEGSTHPSVPSDGPAPPFFVVTDPELSVALWKHDDFNTGSAAADFVQTLLFNRTGMVTPGTKLAITEVHEDDAGTFYKTSYGGNPCWVKKRDVRLYDLRTTKVHLQGTLDAGGASLRSDTFALTDFAVPANSTVEISEKLVSVSDRKTWFRIHYEGATGLVDADAFVDVRAAHGGVKAKAHAHAFGVVTNPDASITLWKRDDFDEDNALASLWQKVLSNAVATLPPGTQLTITEMHESTDGTFYRTIHDGKSGWVKQEDVRPYDVRATKVHLRGKIGNSSAGLYTDAFGMKDVGVPANATVEISEKIESFADRKTWFRVSYAGNSGLVDGDAFVDFHAPPADAKKAKAHTQAFRVVANPESSITLWKHDDFDADSGVETFFQEITLSAVATLAPGTQLTITEVHEGSRGTFYKTSHDGKSGWVAQTDVKPYNVRATKVHLRAKLGDEDAGLYTDAFTLKDVGIPANATVEISEKIESLGDHKTWFRASYGGNSGLVPGDAFVDFHTPPASLVKAAARTQAFTVVTNPESSVTLWKHDDFDADSAIETFLQEITFRAVATLQPGTQLTITEVHEGNDGTFYKATHDGKSGWVKQEDVRPYNVRATKVHLRGRIGDQSVGLYTDAFDLKDVGVPANATIEISEKIESLGDHKTWFRASYAGNSGLVPGDAFVDFHAGSAAKKDVHAQAAQAVMERGLASGEAHDRTTTVELQGTVGDGDAVLRSSPTSMAGLDIPKRTVVSISEKIESAEDHRVWYRVTYGGRSGLVSAHELTHIVAAPRSAEVPEHAATVHDQAAQVAKQRILHDAHGIQTDQSKLPWKMMTCAVFDTPLWEHGDFDADSNAAGVWQIFQLNRKAMIPQETKLVITAVHADGHEGVTFCKTTYKGKTGWVRRHELKFCE